MSLFKDYGYATWEDAFNAALDSLQISHPAEIIADGKIHRFSVNGKRGNTSGYYIIFQDDLVAGHIGDWSTGNKVNWHWSKTSLTETQKLTLADKWDKARKQAKVEQLAIQAETAKLAQQKAQELAEAPNNHPYLVKKGIRAHGIKIGQERLYIPLYNQDKQIVSFQTIDDNGNKLYAKGGQVKGCYYLIGTPTDSLFIAEGFATAASIYEATGIATACTFDAGNMEAATENLAKLYPAGRITICADNDAHKPINKGLEVGRMIATKHGYKLAYPEFTAQELAQDKPPTDFNDLAQIRGKGAISLALFPPTQQTIKEPTQEIILGETIQASDYEGEPIPPRQWLVDNWILRDCVTALYGDGGVGKSLLAMQLMTCCSLGIPFLGIETKKTPVFGFFCEDSEDELQRRQDDINCHYGYGFKDLSTMYWQSRVGCENTLMTFVKDGVGAPTQTYQQLRAEVIKLGAKLVVIDTAADTFGGNENIRPQVRQFINLLGKLALEINGSVLLCAHPSAAGLAKNDGTGGSTAWNNTVRSRLYVSRPVADEDADIANDEEAKNLRELSKMKSNYSNIGDKITIKWERGAFTVEDSPLLDKVSQIEKAVRDKDDEDLFLMLLDKFTAQGIALSENPRSGSTYAPKMMARSAEGKGIRISRFAAAMQRLFDTKKIRRDVVLKGKNRHPKEGLIRC